jgi:NADH-quinone oxidoreductase subunit E
MIGLWVQAALILAVAFGMGLMIGAFLGRLALTQLQEQIATVAPPKKMVTEPNRDYHGYEPEITPLLTPRTEDVPAPHTAPPAPVMTEPKNPMFFPVSSFGVMSESHKKPAAIISPLASLDARALEYALASVLKAQEPTRLMGAPSAKDDLTRIDGIGAVNEAELNDLGIYHFWQIAAWTAEEVVWIAQHIHFPDRIVREHWIKQAAGLLLHDEIA